MTRNALCGSQCSTIAANHGCCQPPKGADCVAGDPDMGELTPEIWPDERVHTHSFYGWTDQGRVTEQRVGEVCPKFAQSPSK